MNGKPVDIEALLAHRPFVQSLARRLVRDEAGAEDLVQETFVTALEHPPRHGGAVRAWLAAVVRNLAWTRLRSERRRRRREQSHPPAQPDPGPEEVLERANWHRRLVNLVMELPEPYRRTVLLRYFEDLNSSEIAGLMRVPAATVRTRLRRGLKELRRRLDASSPGGRAVWVGALAVLARPRPAAAASVVLPPVKSAWPILAASAAGAGLLFFVLAANLPGGRSAFPGRAPVRAPLHGEAAGTRAGGVEVIETESEAEVSPGFPLAITVLREGRPAPEVRLVLMRLDRPSWRYSPYDRWHVWRRTRTGPDGRALFAGAPGGYVRILAATQGFARGERFVWLPREPEQPIVLELERSRRRLRVQVVEEVSDLPIAGARIRLEEKTGAAWLPEPEAQGSDASGFVRFSCVPEGTVAVVRASAAGHASARVRVGSGEDFVLVRLARLRGEVTWRILPGLSPAPGTRVTLRRINRRTVASHGMQAVVLDGALRARELDPGWIPELLAIAPDGRFARLQAGPESSARFERPVMLDLFLRDTRGHAVPGAYVRLYNPAVGGPVFPEGRTDGRGRLLLPVYAAEPVEVRIRDPLFGDFRPVGLIDPARGDLVFEARLPAARSVVVHLPGGVPPGLETYLDRLRLVPEVLALDRLRLRYRPVSGAAPVLHLLAPGRVPFHEALGGSTADPAQIEARLAPAGRLTLRILRASPRQPVVLQLVGGEALRRGPWRFRLYPGPDWTVRETMLPPGVYRVRDGCCGAVSEPFRIVPGGGPVHVMLDLGGFGAAAGPGISGRVVGGAGLDLRATRIAVDGEPASVPVDARGNFTIPWAGRNRLTLTAVHPGALPSSEIAVRRDRPGRVVLHLHPRNRALLRLLLAGTTAPRACARVRVHVTPVGKDPACMLEGALDEQGNLRFGGFAPGRAGIWIDLAGFAPLQLSGVRLRPGANDLGRAMLSRGTVIHLRVVGRRGIAPPDLRFMARALGARRYVRTARAGETVIRGLGPGDVQVAAIDRYTGLTLGSRTVHADGSNAISLAFDLR